MTPADELAALFRRDLTRLVQELEAFPDTAAVWKTVPGISNSPGNLALHLEGNLREYIGRQLGAIEYRRDREREFAGPGIELGEFVQRIESARDVVTSVISCLSSKRLNEDYPENVFGKTLSTRQFLIHLHSHLNYHLGQIDILRRVLTGAGPIPLAEL